MIGWEECDIEDIIDYIRPSIRKKPDFLLVHLGTNDLTNGINTMIKIRKVVATVEEMDHEKKIKLDFSSIICREDVDKTNEIIAVNDRLQKYCLSKGLLFVDNSNIDASCLNRGKLNLNRQGTSILADNFRKSLVSSGWFDESFLNNDENLDCICINPNTSNEADFTVTLRLNRSKYSKNIIFSHLNINSIRNKFENLKEVVSNYVDILAIAETKINRSLRHNL